MIFLPHLDSCLFSRHRGVERRIAENTRRTSLETRETSLLSMVDLLISTLSQMSAHVRHDFGNIGWFQGVLDCMKPPVGRWRMVRKIAAVTACHCLQNARAKTLFDKHPTRAPAWPYHNALGRSRKRCIAYQWAVRGPRPPALGCPKSSPRYCPPESRHPYAQDPVSLFGDAKRPFWA